jgi:hypothetical protein
MGSVAYIPPPQSNRVKAWVYTIINPLIDALRREQLLLEKANLSWRFYSRRCEYIRPIPEYVEASQLPNYEDFLADDLNSSFPAEVERHDRLVVEAEAKAAGFFDGLMRSDLFQRQVQESLAEYQAGLSSNLQYPDLESMSKDLPKYVAEYLINRSEVLPSHYTVHKFWEGYRLRFERSADEYEPYQQRETYRELKSVCNDLLAQSRKLLNVTEKQRQFLCRKYDIPYAPLQPADASHGSDAQIRYR